MFIWCLSSWRFATPCLSNCTHLTALKYSQFGVQPSAQKSKMRRKVFNYVHQGKPTLETFLGKCSVHIDQRELCISKFQPQCCHKDDCKTGLHVPSLIQTDITVWIQRLFSNFRSGPLSPQFILRWYLNCRTAFTRPVAANQLTFVHQYKISLILNWYLQWAEVIPVL